MIKKILIEAIYEHSSRIMSGDIEGLLRYYKNAFPVFIHGEAKLVNGRDRLRTILTAASDRCRAAGVTRIEGSLVNMRKVSAGRYRCLVEWQYHRPGNIPPEITSLVLFCGFDGQQIKVEMVEYKKVAFDRGTGSSDHVSGSPHNDPKKPSGYLH